MRVCMYVACKQLGWRPKGQRVLDAACSPPLRASGRPAGDVTSPDFAEGVVGCAIENFGGLHILVNNAGFTWDGMVHKMTDKQWSTMLEGGVRVLLRCGLLCCAVLRRVAACLRLLPGRPVGGGGAQRRWRCGWVVWVAECLAPDAQLAQAQVSPYCHLQAFLLLYVFDFPASTSPLPTPPLPRSALHRSIPADPGRRALHAGRRQAGNQGGGAGAPALHPQRLLCGRWAAIIWGRRATRGGRGSMQRVGRHWWARRAREPSRSQHAAARPGFDALPHPGRAKGA